MARSLLIAAVLLSSTAAFAQPQIGATPMPAPNSAGWNNSEVEIQFACRQAVRCPERMETAIEGAGRTITGTAVDAAGAEATVTGTLNIDHTPPVVSVISPAGNSTTTAASVQIAARAIDALSGVADATCNGRAAAVDETGTVTCVAGLRPGVNDIVIEAMDRAGNSGSAGIRITRTGTASAIRIVPDTIGLVLGKPTQLQVLDEFGRAVANVAWRVNNPALARMSDDERHTLSPIAPGKLTVTAIAAGLSTDASITIYPGSFVPRSEWRWRIGSIGLVATPDSEVFVGAAPDEPVIFLDETPRDFGRMWSVRVQSGLMAWSERTAIDESEVVVARKTQPIGGGLLVVESRDALQSSLVRGGKSNQGTPWRFRADGALSPDVAQDGAGTIAIVETGRDRFPRLLLIDGATGRLRQRTPAPAGAAVARNIGCVPGANAFRALPATLGPPRIHANGALTFESLRSDDVEDFAQCGGVDGRLRRVLEAVSLAPDGAHVQMLRLYDVPAGSAAPAVSVFPIADDGHGGQLAPWIARYGDGTLTEARVMHITPEGNQEFTLPTVGELFLLKPDLAATTDGTTLVVFNVLTGAVQWTRTFPAKGARILSTANGALAIVAGDTSVIFDEFGRAIPLGRR